MMNEETAKEILEKFEGNGNGNESDTVDPEKLFAEILNTPLTQEEARKMLADIDVQIARLGAIRVQKSLELTQIDQQLAAASFDKSVVYRRVLNDAKAEETKTEE